jgi:tetratricopeptide (TPR) repeat protein
VAARRSWRLIELRTANIALYALIAALGAVYWDTLLWAGREFIGQRLGRISSPRERSMARSAGEMIVLRGPVPEAQALLEESVAVEPASQPVCWLGELHFRARRYGLARQQFERCLRLDPLAGLAYRRMAEILVLEKDAAGARRILERGRDLLRGEIPRTLPRPDPGVASKYNDKAEAVHRAQRDSLRMLERELGRRP